MLNDRRRALYREIDIMDAGNTDGDHTEVFPTTVFSTWVRRIKLETAPQESVVEHVKANTIHLYVSRPRN